METPIATESLVLGRLLARHARYRPAHTAVVVPTGEGRVTRYSSREWDRYVNRLANALTALGVRSGDRVATLLPNRVELLATYWTCARLGAAVVPLSPLLTVVGLVSLLDDAEPAVVIAPRDQIAMLEEVRRRAAIGSRCRWVLVDATEGDAAGFDAFDALHAAASDVAPEVTVSAGDIATIMYTSGTTGLPKGILHTHFIRAMYATLMANSFRMAPESVVLHSGALVFNGAMVNMFAAFMCGATFVIHPSFDPEAFIETVEREGVTHSMLVPAQIIAILNAKGFDPARLQSLQCILSLGAPLHVEYKAQLMRALPRRFYELYGLTEGFVTILDRDDAERKSGSVGIPPPFFEVKIVDAEGRGLPPREIGEIIGRGPITMPGYINRPEATAATLRDGWIWSGDLGYVDEDGYLYLVDRKKDMIDSGGVKVYPKDIEEIAACHPAVREVAVFGIPHDKWGETPLAAVILCAGSSVGAQELKEWINERVAAKYQRVEAVVIMDAFPRNAAGKTLKREMRETYWKGLERRI